MSNENVSECGQYEAKETDTPHLCSGYVGEYRRMHFDAILPQCMADDRRDRRNVIFVERTAPVQEKGGAA